MEGYRLLPFKCFSKSGGKMTRRRYNFDKENMEIYPAPGHCTLNISGNYKVKSINLGQYTAST